MMEYKNLGICYEDEYLVIKFVAVVESNPDKGLLIKYLGYPYLPFNATRRIDVIYYYRETESLVSFNISVPDYNDYYKIWDFYSLGYVFNEYKWTEKDDEFHEDLLREFNCDSSKGIF